MTSSSAPIRIGVIGYGMSAKTFHLPLISSLPNLYSLTAILVRSLPSSSSSSSLPFTTSTPGFLSLVDVVVITTPNDSHFSLASLALKAGKHVIVEKPISITVAEASELIQIANESQRILTVFHNRRWDNDFLTVKKLIQSNALGRIVNFTSRYDRYRPAGKGGWRETDEASGGVLLDLGSHLIDQMLALFGTPTRRNVSLVRNQRQLSTVKTNDYFKLIFEYETPVSNETSSSSSPYSTIVELSAGMLVRQGAPRFEIHGDKGSFIKYGLDVQEEQLKAGVSPNHSSFGVEEKTNWGTVNSEVNGVHVEGKVESEKGNYSEFYRNVAAAIRAEQSLQVTAQQAKQVMEIMNEAMEEGGSAATQKGASAGKL